MVYFDNPHGICFRFSFILLLFLLIYECLFFLLPFTRTVNNLLLHHFLQKGEKEIPINYNPIKEDLSDDLPIAV